MKNKSFIIILILILLPGLKCLFAKEKKTDKEKSLTQYEKLFNGKKCQTCKSGFITIHKMNGKIYLEFPLKYEGKEMLLASTPSSTSAPDLVNVGFKANNPQLVRFCLRDTLMLLNKCSVMTTHDGTKEMEKAVKISYTDIRKFKFKVEAYNRDSSAVVFDASKLFLSQDYTSVGGHFLGLPMEKEVKKDLSTFGKIKAFDDNISIETNEVYDCSLQILAFKVPLGDVSVNTVKTLLLLPENKMKPRIADPRLGIFLTQKHKISPKEGSKYYSYANRWRLIPKDLEAWERGELVEPVKPIVFYLDNTFPENWKPALRKGTLDWNKAFEKIGFKNTVIVKDFPENDNEFDPDNLKYSCIRYCPIGEANAMGPSWVDPRTGEIINASVIIYNDIVDLVTQWRFVQTAQVDEKVRCKELPQDRLYEALVYVIAHEVGHTLGLMHNMAASHAYPVDSLRSVTFTQKYGTTPSIMDYARFNYVAQPGDKGLKLTPPEIGLYDYFAIKWLYTPIAGNRSVEEEAVITGKWLDDKAGEPLYRYGKQQISYYYDPTALTEDLGDDPIKASEYGIKNLKYILPNLNNWIKNDNFSEYKGQLYNQIANQYSRYINNVLYQVGGIYLNAAQEGTPVKNFESVPKNIQKKSMQWVIRQLRDSEWLDDVSVRQLRFAPQYSLVMKNLIAKKIFSIVPRIILSSHHSDDPYTLEDYYNDLFDGIWESTRLGKKLTDGDKLLQRYCVTQVSAAVKSGLGIKNFAEPSIMPDPMMLSVEDIVMLNLDPSGLVRSFSKEFEAFEQEHGRGIIADQLLQSQLLEPNPYKWQKEVEVKVLDESLGYNIQMFKKIKSLIKSKMQHADSADVAHYQAILAQINVLENKF